MSDENIVELTIVLPVFNEEENVVPLCEELTGVLENSATARPRSPCADEAHSVFRWLYCQI